MDDPSSIFGSSLDSGQGLGSLRRSPVSTAQDVNGGCTRVASSIYSNGRPYSFFFEKLCDSEVTLILQVCLFNGTAVLPLFT